MPTLEEIKKFVSEEGISPSEIFERDSLIDDPVVRGYTKAAVSEGKSEEYQARKRNLTEIDERNKEKDEKIKKLEDENKNLKTDGAKVKATELFGTKIKERKLDKQQSEFIKSKQSDFLPEDLEVLEKEVDKFMDAKLEEYKETAKIFGHKIEEKKEDVKGGGEPGEGGSDEDNELIPD